NPFHVTVRCCSFPKLSNSTDSPAVDFPVCTPLTDTDPILAPHRTVLNAARFCTHDAHRGTSCRWTAAPQLTMFFLPALFSAANGSFANRKGKVHIS
ncbi:hypothetical protein CEXT_30581, partial [Caerostris extrusa]